MAANNVSKYDRRRCTASENSDTDDDISDLKQRRIASETNDRRSVRLATKRECERRRRRRSGTAEEITARQQATRVRVQHHRQTQKSAATDFEAALIEVDSVSSIELSETIVSHSCGIMSQKCQHCQASLFVTERLSQSSCSNPRFSLCCGDGKVKLWTVPEPPEPLATLLTDTSIPAVGDPQNIKFCVPGRQTANVIYAEVLSNNS